MEVKLILSTPEAQIGEMAKICYATKAIEDGGKDITKALVHGHGHLAALRFAYATVSISGISVSCHTQIVRSKHLDFMVQSKRYVSVDKGDVSFVMPTDITDAQKELMVNHWQQSVDLYQTLVADGVKKEDARAILPANASTNMNVTGNLQGWMSFFKLRLSKHAQTEVREVALKIFDLLSTKYPQVFIPKVLEDYSNA